MNARYVALQVLRANEIYIAPLSDCVPCTSVYSFNVHGKSLLIRILASYHFEATTWKGDCRVPGGAAYDVFEKPVANESGKVGAVLSMKTFDTFVKRGSEPVESRAPNPPPSISARLRTKSFAVKFTGPTF